MESGVTNEANPEEAMAAKSSKTPTLVGAAAGLTLFLPIGLLPSLLYGGYAGVLLAGGLFGTPIPTHLAARALVVFGMVLGVTSVAALFAVAGAVAGAAVGILVGPRKEPVKAEATK
jgi:hypothetical protein